MSKKTKINNLYFSIFVLGILAGGIFILQRSKNANFCANSLTCKESLEFSINNQEQGTFLGQSIIPPTVNLAGAKAGTKVLAQAAGFPEKRIYVDLTTQTLTAVAGEEVFMQVPISSGKWGRTPTGEFTIWNKVRATKMSGGSGTDYYYLPNVPYVMFFEGSGIAGGQGFALHGTYWHNNFGYPMSHGCINMRTTDAGKLYDWAGPDSTGNRTLSTDSNPGTKITIYGKPPG